MLYLANPPAPTEKEFYADLFSIMLLSAHLNYRGSDFYKNVQPDPYFFKLIL